MAVAAWPGSIVAVGPVGVPDNPPDWRRVDGDIYGRQGPAQALGLNAPTNAFINATLYRWGPLEFHVWPLNINEVDHETATDWAHKDIVGASIYREWVGEGDEKLHFRGMLFPYRLGGVRAMEAFDGMRRGAIAGQMVRGDGGVLGWFVCERIMRAHTFISTEGWGKQITFEAEFARVPIPEPAGYLTSIWMTTGAPGVGQVGQ